MKKPLAVLLLIVGALVVIFGLAFLYLIMVIMIEYAGLLIAIAATLAAGIGIDRLRRLFRKKYEIKAPLFFVCAYLPSIIGSAIYFAVYTYLDSIGYFKGFLGGLGEMLMGLSWIGTAAAFAAAGGLYLLISFIIEKKRGNAGK